MLRRLLAGFAIASLLLGAILLVFWWRSFRHVDHLALPVMGGQKSEFTSQHGIVMVTNSRKEDGMIAMRSDFYDYRRILGACLIIPALWLAIFIRSKLPRPGGRPRDRHLPLSPPPSGRF
jgi:hypothetical protein